jgi:hypothetical protein
MTSVRSRSLASSAPKMDDDEPSECLIISQYISASSLPLLQENKENLDDHGEGEDDEDDKKPLMVTKK